MVSSDSPTEKMYPIFSSSLRIPSADSSTAVIFSSTVLLPLVKQWPVFWLAAFLSRTTTQAEVAAMQGGQGNRLKGSVSGEPRCRLCALITLRAVHSDLEFATGRAISKDLYLRALMAVQEHWNETAQRQVRVQSRASTAYGSKAIEGR